MITVLDASAAIEILLSRSQSAELKKYLLESGEVVSPELFKAEIANVLWKYVRAGLLAQDQANVLLGLGLELIDDYIDMKDNITESMNEAVRLDHPVYDMLYLTLARRRGARLLTLDKKLKGIAQSAGVMVNE
jgi:predicted nucleic acid-binding protein